MTPRAQVLTTWLQAHERAALLALFIETWYEESPPASATHHTDRA